MKRVARSRPAAAAASVGSASERPGNQPVSHEAGPAPFPSTPGPSPSEPIPSPAERSGEARLASAKELKAESDPVSTAYPSNGRRATQRGAPANTAPTGQSELAADDLTDAVSAAQRGDEEAFRALYRATQPRLLRYLRTLVPDEAEDVASESWLQVARDLPTFKGDYAGFRGWVATIGRHRALDHLRRKRRRPVDAAEEQLVNLPSREDTEALATDSVATQSAVRLIRQLPRDQAEAVLLRAVMGLDAPAAGRVLGKRAGAVRTAAYRGLRRLAELLEQSGHAIPAQRGSSHPAVRDHTTGVPQQPASRETSANQRVTRRAAAALKELR
ncbi:MAG: sigma-70 family RNA polymerase sigma factor [Micromonosporaceae bacterium]|nr:sigma-70 family RNA polymerase sigma factor [Micromonosporaceae bacterium]